MTKKVSRAQAVAMLWHQGILTWKLKPVQADLYNSLQNMGRYKILVWSCSRRLGKSYCLSVVAIEHCLKNPNTIVKFLAPTQKHIKTILYPIFRDILKDCPEEIRPEFRTADNVYRFTNGSEVQLAGTDSGHAEGLRGGNSHLCLIDEAGFCDSLKYIITSILIPTTTTTKGKIILSSTPPISADHDFAEYMEEAENRGTFVKKTIYDGIGSTITEDDLKDIIEEQGGVGSNAFRREYLCELIKGDDSSFVVPEFNDEIIPIVVKDWPRPPHYDIYVSGDIGFEDLTVMLFAYYDFRNAKIVIEDELVMNGPRMTTKFLAEEIRRKERELYCEPTGEQREPYLRICDNNLILINDLQRLHGITFLPTAKDDKEAVINQLRMLIQSHRVVINPRCKVLVSHLKHARWNKTRRSYIRNTKDGHHYDAVDAVAYLVRNVQQTKNPYPSNFGSGSGDNWFTPPSPTGKPEPVVHTQIKKIFKIRRSF